ncbi:CHAT domain-containing protein [Herbidospora cretacea]|uniref:CHAT domain-containing protein n=1 Tax=Herbidospora cretacea TaxID=28444 RepID=UPI000773BABD|nr:CHAT domain-containing protein [Herbidospora cretacea]
MTDEKATLLSRFVFAPSLEQKLQLLRDRPELLREDNDELLAALEGNDNEQIALLALHHRALLRRCRAAGIDEAFAEITDDADLNVFMPAAIGSGWVSACRWMEAHVGSRDPGPLRAAISAFDELIRHPEFPGALTAVRSRALAIAGRARLWSLNEAYSTPGFDQALSLLEAGLAGLPDGSHPRVVALFDLGQCWYLRGENQGSAEAFDRAHACLAESVLTGLLPAPVEFAARELIGRAARLRFELAPDPEVVRRADPLLSGPAPDPESRTRLTLLRVDLLQSLFLTSRDPTVIGEGRRAVERELELLGPDTPASGPALLAGARLLLIGGSATDEPTQLDAAAALARRALAVTDDPEKDKLLLALILRQRLARDDDRRTAHELIEIARDLLPTDQRQEEEGPARWLVAGLGYFAKNSAPRELGEAEARVRAALDELPAGSPAHAEAQELLGTVLHDRYVREGDRALLDEVVDTHRRALAEAPDASAREQSSAGLAEALLTSFTAHGRAELLAEAEQLLTHPAAGPPGSSALSVLGRIQLARYRAEPSAAALDRAVVLLREAVAATSGDVMEELRRTVLLGCCLHERFEATGDPADLAEALDLDHRARGLGVPTDPGSAAALEGLGVLLPRLRGADPGSPGFHALLGDYHTQRYLGMSRRFEAESDLGLALRRLTSARQEGSALPDLAEQVVVLHDGLADVFNRNVRARGDAMAERIADLSVLQRELARGLPAEQESCAGLALALHSRYLLTGHVPSLARAGEAALDWLELSGGDQDPESARAQTALGSLAMSRYTLHGVPGDLEQAIRYGRGAVAVTPEDDPDFGSRLGSLATALKAGYQSGGAPSEIDEAIRTAGRALELTDESHLNHGVILGSLASAHQVRFERTGDPADLDRAIAYGRRAGDHAPYNGLNWCHLSFALEARFELLQDPESLDEAVDVARKAVRVASKGDPELPRYWSALSIAVRMRFRHARVPDPADLDEAVEAGANSVRLTPPGHACLPMWAQTHALALRTRSEHTGSAADMESAMAALRLGVGTPGSPAMVRAQGSANLAVAYMTRFHQSDDDADLAEAVACLRSAISLDRDGDLRSAGYTLNLANALLLQADRGANPAARREAEELMRAGSVAHGSPLPLRLSSAIGAAGQAARRGAWPESVADFTTAIELLPRLAGRSLSRETRQELLRELSGLAQNAAAAALHDGAPDRALELLEQGRGILLSQELDARSDLTELRERHSGLADELDEVRATLSGGEEASGEQEQRIRDRRHQADRRWRELLAEIREQAGFEDFLSLPSATDLTSAARNGPLVAVNLSALRCDALVLDASGKVRAVPLPPLGAGELAHSLREFERARGQGDVERACTTLDRLLTLLGERVAGPVLTALGHTGPPPADGPWPQVQWMPTGPLAFLPLHAARLADGSHVLDRVISSYTTTIRSLRRAQLDPREGPRRALIVGEDETVLPNAPDEARMVAATLKAVAPLIGPDARLAAVRRALPEIGWAHFACHGKVHPADPGRSALVLADGDLSAAEIIGMDIDADVAYLSACSTAHGDLSLADESLHLASAFQVAGFRHVIGTLWPVDDEAAYAFATAVYADLDGRADRLATAAHHATRHIRARYRLPLIWASHIHFGPTAPS